MDVSSCFLIFLLLSSVSGLILPLTKSNGDPDLTSLISHVTLLEQTMTSLQTQVQTTNSKLQATEIELNTVKINLQRTEDELKVVKSDLKSAETDIAILKNDLQKGSDSNELTNLKSEFEALKMSYNSLVQQINITVIDSVSRGVKSNMREIQSLNTRQNNTEKDLTKTKSEVQTAVYDVKTVQSQVNSISGKVNTFSQQVIAVKNQTSKYEGFQAHQELSGSQSSFNLRFHYADRYGSGGYNLTSGMFTTSFSGMYIFWINVRFDNSATSSSVSIFNNRREIATAFAQKGTGENAGVASTMAVVNLYQGAVVHFVANPASAYINGGKQSSYGGALLHAT